MSKTKLDHINLAYSLLVISGITKKPNNDDIELALVLLEDMMHEFRSRNICSTYIFEDSPQPGSDSGVNPAYNNAVSTNLAVKVAVAFGKEAPQTIKTQAIQSLSNWSARTGITNQIKPPRRQARGSGNTFRFSNWVRFYRVEPSAPSECDTFTLKTDAIDFFSIDFNPYLLNGATIVSFELDISKGIEVKSSSESVGIITLECKGLAFGFNFVKITVITSTGRVNPEIVNFNITQ